MGKSEDPVRNLVMKLIYGDMGIPGSWPSESATEPFRIRTNTAVAVCAAEQPLEYGLPNGATLTHKSDVLISWPATTPSGTINKYVSIEVKHKSAVTDQFKCRAFDVLHLKETYGENFYGIMVYARAGSGSSRISIPQAKKICYAFDEFVGFEYSAANQGWRNLIQLVRERIEIPPSTVP